LILNGHLSMIQGAAGFHHLSNPDEVPGSAEDAYSALQLVPCAGLFNLPRGVTPWSILNNPKLQITYSPEDDPDTDASTSVGENGGIVLNFNTDPGSAYLTGGASEAANTIIHELLHIAVALYGPGAVSAAWNNHDTAPDDATPAEQAAATAAQNSNQSLIATKCGVGSP
jgi:hypothetical protein